MITQIPIAVQQAIRDFLIGACRRGEGVWKNFEHEEDAITGGFLANFSTEPHIQQVGKQVWAWEVDYFKFRGRGKGAFESVHGSDGIFQIIVKDQQGHIDFRKGLLFQAKKVNGSFSDLVPQVQKMEKVARNSSVAFIYGPNGFKATLGSDIIANVTKKNSFLFEHDIAKIIADDFINCTVGKVDLFFDREQEALLLVDPYGLTQRSINLKKPSNDIEIQIKRLR